jgi:hypothetical protein
VLGDVLSFTNAVLKKAGCKELKTNTECWKLITQGGKTMQLLKQEAADKAKELRVNPRSIKEWKALGDGDLSKIRRLGANAPGDKEQPQDTPPKPAAKSPARKPLSADSSESAADSNESPSESEESEDASLEEEDDSEDKKVPKKSAIDSKVFYCSIMQTFHSTILLFVC